MEWKSSTFMQTQTEKTWNEADTTPVWSIAASEPGYEAQYVSINIHALPPPPPPPPFSSGYTLFLLLSLQFTVHSNLGRAIKQVINEFVTHPPELLPPESSMASTLQPPQPSSLPSQSQPQYVHYNG